LLKDDESILIDGAQKIGINLNKEQIKKFSQYLELLIQWNQKINLTSLKTPKEIIIKHFLDSISCIEIINKYIDTEGISIIDVGAGAGLPGVPIKIICSSIRLSLLEARKKKTIFLEKIKEEINLQQVKILNGRAETFGKGADYREKYDVALSRAVARLNVLSEYCLPLVRVGGLLVAQKGRSYKEEIDKALSSAFRRRADRSGKCSNSLYKSGKIFFGNQKNKRYSFKIPQKRRSSPKKTFVILKYF